MSLQIIVLGYRPIDCSVPKIRLEETIRQRLELRPEDEVHVIFRQRMEQPFIMEETAPVSEAAPKRQYRKRELMIKVCENCQSKFKTKRASQRFCSHRCANQKIAGTRLYQQTKDALAENEKLRKQLAEFQQKGGNKYG